MESIMKNKRVLTGVIVAAVAVVIAIIVGIIAFGNRDDSKLQKLLDAGQKYLAELDYEQAVAAYEEAIALDPKCVEAYSGLAEAYFGLGDVDSAVAALEEGFEQTGEESLILQLEEMLKRLEETKAESSATPEKEAGETVPVEKVEATPEPKDEFAIVVPEDYVGEVLIDNDTYTVAVDKIEVDEDFYVTISLTNKTGAAMNFTLYNPAINGLMYDDGQDNQYLEAGQSDTMEIRIRDSWLEKYGIEKITEILLTIEAVDSNYSYLGREMISVYPFGEGEAEYYIYEPGENEVLIAETENIRLYAGMEALSSSFEVLFYVENLSGDVARFNCEAAAANNNMMEMYFNHYIAPGKGGYVEEIVFDDDLGDAGVRVEDVVKLSFLCNLTKHTESLNSYGAYINEDVFSQNVELYVPGKENVEIVEEEINGEMVLDNEYCSIYLVRIGFGEKPYLEFTVASKTERMLDIALSNGVIDGKVSARSYDSGQIGSNARGNFKATWNLDELQGAGVDIGAVEGFPYAITFSGSNADGGELLFETNIEARSFEKG